MNNSVLKNHKNLWIFNSSVANNTKTTQRKIFRDLIFWLLPSIRDVPGNSAMLNPLLKFYDSKKFVVCWKGFHPNHILCNKCIKRSFLYVCETNVEDILQDGSYKKFYPLPFLSYPSKRVINKRLWTVKIRKEAFTLIFILRCF